MSKKDSYYVYVYVDPRNFEEFYYGKGKGSRKDAHLTEESDSEKSKRIGFISAGQGARWRDAMLGFNTGDVVAAYLKGQGFVGIGQIKAPARPVREVVIDGMPLLKQNLQRPNLGDNAASDELCEYVATVNWISLVPRAEANGSQNPISSPRNMCAHHWKVSQKHQIP